MALLVQCQPLNHRLLDQSQPLNHRVVGASLPCCFLLAVVVIARVLPSHSSFPHDETTDLLVQRLYSVSCAKRRLFLLRIANSLLLLPPTTAMRSCLFNTLRIAILLLSCSYILFSRSISLLPTIDPLCVSLSQTTHSLQHAPIIAFRAIGPPAPPGLAPQRHCCQPHRRAASQCRLHRWHRHAPAGRSRKASTVTA